LAATLRSFVVLDGPGTDSITVHALGSRRFEVIYTGCHQTPEQIAAAAIQEDVDLVGLSCLSGAHRYLFPRVVELLKKQGADDIAVIGGGIIPDQDFQMLYDANIKAVFTPGTPLDAICQWVQTNIQPRG